MSTIGIAIQQSVGNHRRSIGRSRHAKSYQNAFTSNLSGSDAPASNVPEPASNT